LNDFFANLPPLKTSSVFNSSKNNELSTITVLNAITC